MERIKPWKKYAVKGKHDALLSRHDPDDTDGFPDKKSSESELIRQQKNLVRLQDVLYAEARHSLLVVLQGLDAAGKDGSIAHIFSGVNPQGCTVSSFKVPTAEESRHDFLWRVHKLVPALGMIGIFNRSHYEDVLVVRVHGHLSKDALKQRYEAINDFEHELTENGTTILKFFLHISKDEQARRLQRRLDDPRRRWKFTLSDFEERRYWDAYQDAYEDVFRHCSTGLAPWYVVPANNKWFRNVAISQIIVHALEHMDLKYPRPRLRKFPRFT